MPTTTFKHGIYYTETSTDIAPDIQYGQIPCYIGTAPIHLATNPAQVNRPVLVSTLTEFREKFGYVEDFSYTLCEPACYHFKKANIAPIICINVLDLTNNSMVTASQSAIVKKDGSVFTLTTKGVIKSTVTVKGIENYTDGDENDKIQLSEATELNANATVGKFIYQGYDIVNSATTGYEEVVNTTPSEGEISLEDAQAKNPNATVGDFIAIEQSYLLSNTSVTGSKEIIANYTSLVASDYILSFDTDGNLVITPEVSGNITNTMNALQVSFSKINLAGITSTHIIGSVDSSTGERTGLQAIDYILGEIGQPPGMLLAPGFSHMPAVTQAFIEKSQSVSGLFPSLVVADIDSSATGSPYYGGVKTWKDNNGYNYKDLVACYPMAKVGDLTFHMSTIVAATKQSTLSLESAYNTPCESPSNKSTVITSLVNMKGDSIVLDIGMANYLNAMGIVTALKMALDFVIWGNYTTVYPESKEPKDCWISTRSLFHYIVNIIIMTYWRKIDERSTKTAIQNIEDGVNNWLNSLATKEVIKTGSCEFLGLDNESTENMVNFNLTWSDVKPAQTYNFNFQFDKTAYEALAA